MTDPVELTAATLEGLLPKHKAALYLTHNDHKTNYQTVGEHLCLIEGMIGRPLEFINLEERRKAIATDELWHLQWYPETPVGFCDIYAASLASLLYYLKMESRT